MREVSEGDRITEQNNLIDELTGAKTMRAILINPKDQTITEIEFIGDYKRIQQLIDADCFDCVRLGDEEENTIYVDDEGLINGVAQRVGMFRVDGDNPAYLAGKGLILATDAEGESAATKLDIEELRKIVAFGEMVRVRGRLVFTELKHGESVTPETFMRNRFWAVED